MEWSLNKLKRFLLKSRKQIFVKIKKDGVKRRVLVQKKFLIRLRRELRRHKLNYFRLRKKINVLRLKYRQKIEKCYNSKTQNLSCDKEKLYAMLDRIQSKKQKLSKKERDHQLHVFDLKTSVRGNVRLLKVIKKESNEQDEIMSFVKDITEKYVLKLADKLPLEFIRKIERIFTTKLDLIMIRDKLATPTEKLAIEKKLRDLQEIDKKI